MFIKIEVMTKTIEIEAVEQSNGVVLPNAEIVKRQFQPFLDQAQEWLESAKKIEVDEKNIKKTAKEARETRLLLKDQRVSAEKLAKNLKRAALDHNSLVNACVNTVTEALKPVEAELLRIEKHVELKEKEAKDELRRQREAELEQYSEFMIPNVDVAEMDEHQFQEILGWTKQKWEQAEAAKRKIEEEEKKAKEAKEAEEKRIREENERLKKEKEIADKKAAELKLESDRKIAEARRQAEEEAKAQREKEEAELKAVHGKLKAYAEKGLKKLGFIETEGGVSHTEVHSYIGSTSYSSFESQKEANEWLVFVKDSIDKAIANKKEKEEQEAKRLEEVKKQALKEAKEAEEKKKLEEAQKLALAPDKEKLEQLKRSIEAVDLPECHTNDAQLIVIQTKQLLHKVAVFIQQKSQEL